MDELTRLAKRAGGSQLIPSLNNRDDWERALAGMVERDRQFQVQGAAVWKGKKSRALSLRSP